jgi:hypothetical protein
MYANLNEVYGTDFGSGSSRDKTTRKKRKKNIHVPMETSEMETELSNDDMNEFKMRNSSKSKVSRLGINQYDPFSNSYNNVNNETLTNIVNENAIGPNNPYNHPYSMYHYTMNDPDYRDFLVYKKMKNGTNDLYEPFTNKKEINSDDFDQLLLYIFTGLFILIMFDNVYKLGVNL